MSNPITVLAPIKLAAGKSETDLLAASEKFQKDFCQGQPGLLRRELIRTGENEYLDIVQFRSVEDAEEVIEKEKVSPACHEFFSVMDIEGMDEDASMEFHQSLATYS